VVAATIVVAALVFAIVAIVKHKHDEQSSTSQTSSSVFQHATPLLPSTTSTPTVTPVAEAALDGLLLSPDQINTAMGTTGMTVSGALTAMSNNSANVADKACQPVQAPAEAAAYADSGWKALRESLLREPGNTWTHHVDQAVVLFSSALDADKFFTASAQSWLACSNRQYTYTEAGKADNVWTVGPVSNTSGTLSVTQTQLSSNSWACQRALTVANNVAIDVTACNYGQAESGVNIAHQIAAKVPT